MCLPTLLVLFLLPACTLFQKPPEDELVAQLDREVIALKQRIAWLEAQGQGNIGEPAPIYPELVQIFSGSAVGVSREGQVSLLSFPVSMLFASTATTRLRSESRMYLDLLGTALQLHPEYRVEVVGYTDDMPPSRSQRYCTPTNWELAALRAAAVARALIDDYSLDPQRVTVCSRGELDPVSDNDTPEGRAANRRVVVRVIPEDSALPEVPP